MADKRPPIPKVRIKTSTAAPTITTTTTTTTNTTVAHPMPQRSRDPRVRTRDLQDVVGRSFPARTAEATAPATTQEAAHPQPSISKARISSGDSTYTTCEILNIVETPGDQERATERRVRRSSLPTTVKLGALRNRLQSH